MSTDTYTLPRRALEHDRTTTTTPRSTSAQIDARPTPTRRPSRGVALFRLLLETRHPAGNPLLMVGPNGAPVWTYQAQ